MHTSLGWDYEGMPQEAYLPPHSGGERKTPRVRPPLQGPLRMWQVCGREMGENEKPNSLNTMKRGGTGRHGVERNSPMRVHYTVA